MFVVNSRSCSEDNIPITLHVEMSQQISRTKGAHSRDLQLPADAGWAPWPHWHHPELQLLSAVTATVSSLAQPQLRCQKDTF